MLNPYGESVTGALAESQEAWGTLLEVRTDIGIVQPESSDARHSLARAYERMPEDSEIQAPFVAKAAAILAR
jgi:hypothetical protein